jgi:thiamine-phosphate pyrophosphorylase
MKLTVVTSSTSIENEHQIIERMFRHGLRYLHVRKPKYTKEKMKKYLEGFSEEYLEKIIVHSHHSLALSMNLKGIHLTEKHRENSFGVWKKFRLYKLVKPRLQITTSFHKLHDINHSNEKYDYIFFSPVFKSISKEDYDPAYTLGTIYDTLHHTKENVVALGGVTDENIATCYETRFWGVALSGYLWQAEDPVKNFDTAKDICNQYKTQ